MWRRHFPFRPMRAKVLAPELYVADALRTATEDLALAVSVYGRRLPVLFRVWNMPDLPHGEQGLEWIDALVSAALNEAWVANAALVKAIEKDPSVRVAVSAGGAGGVGPVGIYVPERGVSSRAGGDRPSTGEDAEFWSQLGMVVGALDVMVGLAGAVPWVGAVLAIMGLVVGGADLVEEYLKEAEKEAAFKAVLDPSRALAAEPDYSGLLLGVVFSLLDVKGVRETRRGVRRSSLQMRSSRRLR